MCVANKRQLTHACAVVWLGALFGLVVSNTANAQANERTVSIGGAVTEILYALGYDSRIAAIDTTSLYPSEALKTKPNVGYMRALSVEGVLSVNPSLIVASEGAGPPAALTALQESGIRMVTVPDDKSPAGVQRKILIVGELVGQRDAARKLADDVDARFVSLAAQRARIEKPKSILFVLSASGGKTLVGGRGTSADAIIALAGATNAAASIEGFKPMSDEAIVGAAPDVVLMMRRENASAGDILATAAFAATPAGKAHALLQMDGNYLLGFGPRAPDAARDLMAALYPELKLPSPPRTDGVDLGHKQ
ncbi:MAG: hemin ABC transporter substrate-binding protein [Alphaproteobacteria bacterium]|nr:hemin ABC transporter substrate-binding protein [Alphaproteobacteria bacterium]MBM3626140.1 hemin ABC transporter substrate-binding protein [Alphaproteobacteria bacterium]MBM3639881.1 hemin ABC transporter substrate-binding protein [Alphaproteobacteria bacterium]